ncbi:hypothetical protein HA402_014708 [Bradysia odoriphaga]|nr:hypothetical protein HA402_014708 [Bradysia odoriphaga]
MSYLSRRMNSILTLSIIIVFVNSQSTQPRMCYVCGKGSQEPFTQTSKGKLEYSDMDMPLSCDEFDSTTNLEKFIFTCPSNYVGCITHSDGIDVTRTCEQLAINDCQTANGVEYCYCTEDLCNKRLISPIQMKHETFYDDEDASDMDAFDASGYGASDTVLEDTMETTINAGSSSSSSSSLPTIRNIEPPLSSEVTVTTKVTTVTTPTEAITANKVFTTSYNQSHTIPSTKVDSMDTNTSSFVKCSKVITIMQLLLMLIFPLCY